MKLGREAQIRWQWLSSLVKEFRLVLGSKEIREGCEVRDVLSISKSDMQCGLLDILLRRTSDSVCRAWASVSAVLLVLGMTLNSKGMKLFSSDFLTP